MVYLHRSFLRHSVEQDVIANMWSDLLDDEREGLGQLRVAIAFADLVGFVRFTEEEGEQEALDLVESFVALGRGVAARQRASGQEHRRRRDDRRHRPCRADGLGDRLPGGIRAALASAHRPSTTGARVYRDGDYFGGNVNLASRVVARAHAGEVLVTDAGRGGGRRRAPTWSSSRSARRAAEGVPRADGALSRARAPRS